MARQHCNLRKKDTFHGSQKFDIYIFFKTVIGWREGIWKSNLLYLFFSKFLTYYQY